MFKKEKSTTKVCKKCMSEIDVKAKKCPNCGSKQGMNLVTKVIALVFAVGIAGAILGSGDSSEKPDMDEPVEYISVTKDELDSALDKNPANAKDMYLDKHVVLKGKLSNIDSDLEYISVSSETDEYDIMGVHCSINDEKTKEAVKKLEMDQVVTVKGEITDVGEVFGYYLDIEEIVTE